MMQPRQRAESEQGACSGKQGQVERRGRAPPQRIGTLNGGSSGCCVGAECASAAPPAHIGRAAAALHIITRRGLAGSGTACDCGCALWQSTPSRSSSRHAPQPSARGCAALETSQWRRFRFAARTSCFALTSAPFSKSAVQTDAWPRSAATCSGVLPSCARPTQLRAPEATAQPRQRAASEQAAGMARRRGSASPECISRGAAAGRATACKSCAFRRSTEPTERRRCALPSSARGCAVLKTLRRRRYRGAARTLAFAFTSAPFSKSNVQSGARPPAAAKCSRVQPSCARPNSFAPQRRRCSHVSALQQTGRKGGSTGTADDPSVLPARSTACGSHPARVRRRNGGACAHQVFVVDVCALA
jgi:hypothetical protein